MLPGVSVVIAWVNPLELLLPGLEALHRQEGCAPDEIIVATRHDAGMREELRKRQPGVMVLEAAAGTTIPALRSMGIRVARGAIIAVTEDHCVPGANWIATIEHHIKQRGADVVGGPVEN